MAALCPLFRVVASASLVLTPALVSAQGGKPNTHNAPPASKPGLPLVFEGNEGQYPAGLDFVGRTERYSVAIGARDVRFALPGKHDSKPVVLSLRGAQETEPVGLAEAAFRTNYYIGSKPSEYHLGVRNYNRVGLTAVYPGIDVQFYASGNTIEHDFLVAPGADASRIAINIAAVGKRASLDAAGDLVIKGEEGELRLNKPVAYQTDARGKRQQVPASFVLASADAGHELRFRLGNYDHSRQLVIDPLIQYATFFDGSAGSSAAAVALDSAGDTYMAGYTNSAPGDFGVTPTNQIFPASVLTSLVTRTGSAAFLAKFNPAGSATQVAWLDFFAGSAGDTKATSVGVQPGGAATLVAVGGTTQAADLPTTIGSAKPAVTAAGNYGFAGTFLMTTGTQVAATYVDSNASGATTATTAVNGVAMDSAGNTYAVGTATGGSLPVTANAFAVDPALVAQPTIFKGFVFELSPIMAVPAAGFVSYVNGSGGLTTTVTCVAVDSAGANIWVGGHTDGLFPRAGTYDTTKMFNRVSVGDKDAFLAQLVPGPAASSILYSDWFDGGGDDILTSLVLDGSGNLFAFGYTPSTNFITTAVYTYSGSTPVTTPSPGLTGSPVTGTSPTKNPPATLSGFVVKLDNTGKPLVITYLGGSGNDMVTSGAVSSSGLVYAAGSSTSPSKMGYTGATVLPLGEDTTPGSSQRGFVLQLQGDLSAVNYVANLGGAAGPDTAVGVAADSSGNAYVGANITSTSAYTTAGALQTARLSSAGTAAYLAVVQPQASTLPITLAAVPCAGMALASPPTGCPDPIAFPNGPGAPTSENVTYTFSIRPNGGTPSLLSSVATTVTVGAPTGAGGTPPLTYNSVTLTDTNSPSTAYPCTGTTATGFTCLISPGYPQTVSGTLDTFSLVVAATLTAQPPTAMTAISVPVTLADLAFDTQNVIEVSNIAIPAQLSIALTTQSPAGGSTVFTTNSGTPTPGKTQVSYLFTIANAAGAGGDATGVSFTFPAVANGLIVTGIVSNSSTGSCVVSSGTCSNLSVAHAASITVTVTGVYPDSALASGTGAGSAANFTVSASGSFSYPQLAVTPNLTLHRGVHLALSAPAGGSFNAPAGSDGHFRLGESITYSVTATNNGPSGSLANADTVSFTYPAGFSVTGTSTGGTCTTSPCSLSAPAIASGASATVTITGNFPDTSANAGIVGTTSVSEGFSSSAAESTATPPLDYDSLGVAGDTANSASTSVERVVALVIATPSITPPATACSTASSCLYMQNTGDISDRAGYSFTLTNNGPNVAVGATFTIILPSAPANPAGTNHPLVSGPVSATLTPNGTVANFGTALTCTYAGGAGVTPANNKINCSGNLAPGTVVVSGQLTVDASTVPSASTAVSTTATAGSASASANAVGTAPATQTVAAVEVDRAAHLVAKMTLAPSLTAPATKLNLDETGTATAGTNDTVSITTAVDSVPLNTVSATLSIVLPKWFRLASLPALTTTGGAAATACTVGGSALTLPYTTNATPATLVCAITTLPGGGATPPTGGTGAVLNTQQVKVVFSGKFLDNGAGTDITGISPTAKVNSLTASLGSATVTFANAVDAYPTFTADASTSSSFAVQRLVSMHIRKTRNNFGSATAPNLDEHPGGSTLGTNDEIEYEVALGNSGVNQAVGIQFTDTLPPYFTVTGLFPVAGAATAPDARNAVPTTLAAGSMACYLGTSTAGTPITLPLTTPISTGATSQAITCTYGETATVPLALPATSFTTDFQSTAVELVYQGKFQDNAPGVDDIPASTNSYTTPANSTAVTTAPYSLDPNDGETAAGPTYSVQRSAHLTLVSIAGVTDARTFGTVTAAGEAQPSISSPGTFVYNCVRFTAILQNTGKNIARTPQMSVSLPYKFVLSSVESAAVTSTSGTNTLATGCAYGTSAGTTVTAPSSLAPTSETTATSGLLVDFDGYFDTDALGVVKTNSTTAGLTFASLSDSSIVDPGPAFTATAGPTVAVVNTPYGSNFTVKPYSVVTAPATPTQPTLVTFTSVGAAGATTLTVGGAAGTMPQGISRDPRYTAKMNLYQAGTGPLSAGIPLSYQMSTSAGTVSGNTGICFFNPAGGALSDLFFKPERVLLWAVSGLPAGTTVSTVPNVTSPYTGDITSSVTPVGGGSYIQAQYTGAVFPAPQAQPQTVCGTVTGFAPTGTPSVFEVLEPVNLPPLIIPNSGSITTPPGKGVSEVSYLFPTSHDYNDNDPCYVSISGVVGRHSCDDNMVLTTRLFGADKLVPAQGHVYGPLPPVQAATYSATVFEVQASATFFPVVTDQLGEINYQLASGGSVTTAGSASNCDPGATVYASNPSILYAPGTACTLETLSAFSGTPSQATVNYTNAYKTPLGSSDMAQLVPSTTGGSSPLIVLPDATTPTSSSSGVVNSGANAAGTVNAGQSVGFLWRLSNILKNATFTNITCYQVNASDLTTKVAFSSGISCLAPSSNDTTFGDPAVYVSTQSGILYSRNGASGWRMASGLAFAGLMVPFLLFRRRLKVAGQLVILALLSLGAVTGLTGCGTGTTTGVVGGNTPTVATGTYWFRLSATQTTGATTTTYYSTAFKVTVVNGS